MDIKLKCAVVDDEPLALELISSYVKRTPFLELVGEFNNSLEVLDSSQIFDLIFLDIQMPDLNGLELGKFLNQKEISPKIIFTTAFNNYAIEGYKINAINYLLKPISYEEFLESAQKAYNLISNANKTNNSAKSIYVKSDYKLVKVDISKIEYIEGLKDYIKIYIAGAQQPILTLMSLKEMEEKLFEHNFLRIHRSFIINMNEIKYIEKSRITLNNGKVIPIGDSYKNNIDLLTT